MIVSSIQIYKYCAEREDPTSIINILKMDNVFAQKNNLVKQDIQKQYLQCVIMLVIQLTCHPICLKCYQPKDNTTNQYCTMCIAGQRRVLTNDYRCVCQDGYGSDGISDICRNTSLKVSMKCHYSYLSYKGPFETDCEQCSSASQRYLTINNKCVCN
ncbi:unnamed protein product [Paramecium octaurelia]|uniref:Uncharacterized protein n=1 Tax=Paramecium octaurelia TaxID=43137 RepID=A0A8S1X9J8_PAROT|nr:unnamed protein product [Paramecium octaurelia]